MADQARTIRIPVHLVEVINKLARVQQEMLQDLGREPNIKGACQGARHDTREGRRGPDVRLCAISLQAPLARMVTVTSLTSSRTPRRLCPPTRCRSRCCRSSCICVLGTLSEREEAVVSMRFGLGDGQPKTLDEIGKVYGVTRERVRQIESKTMSKLRHPSRSQVLRGYLD